MIIHRLATFKDESKSAVPYSWPMRKSNEYVCHHCEFLQPKGVLVTIIRKDALREDYDWNGEKRLSPYQQSNTQMSRKRSNKQY